VVLLPRVSRFVRLGIARLRPRPPESAPAH